MLWHIVKNRVLRAAREWDTLFWTTLFPCLLGTLFSVLLGTAISSDRLQTIPVAVVEDAAYAARPFLGQALGEAAGGDGALLHLISCADETEAFAKLRSGEADGVVRVVDGEIVLSCAQDGIGPSVLKTFLDSYCRIEAAVEDAARENPARALLSLRALGGESRVQAQPLDAQVPEASYYFFTLIAMVCLYGSFQGLNGVMCMQANLSPLGARQSLSPVGKLPMLAGELIGTFLVQFASVLLVLLYLIGPLRVDFGPRFALILPVCAVGTMAGVSMGALVGAVSRLRESVKTGLLIGVSMLFCMLAGMMNASMGYAVAEHAPIVALVNPAARISDALYCLFYSGELNRYGMNLLALAAFSAVLLIISCAMLRRRQYASL